MKNQTAFDLNHAVQNWRETLAQSPAFERENLNELESHLRDSVATLQARGLSAEEAFIIAAKRIGTNGLLEKEFGKVNSRAVWIDRLLWILLGLQLKTLIANISNVTTSIISPLGLRLNELLPGFGLHKAGEISLRNTFSVICCPLAIWIASGVLVWRFVGLRRRVSDLIQASLKRPWSLACGLFLVCAVLRIAAALAFRFWYLPVVYHAPVGSSVTALILLPFVDAIMAGLTVIVARKRLRATAA